MIFGPLIILLIDSMFFFVGLAMFLIVKDGISLVFTVLGLISIYFGIKGIIISQEDDPTLLVNGVPICKVRIEFTDDCVIKEKEFQTYSIDYNRYKVGKRVKVYKYGNEYYWDNKDVKEDYVVWL